MHIEDLQALLGEIYPDMEDPSYNGLQVMGATQITSVATAVSADLATIRKAAELGASALIVHHGLFWRKSDPRIISTTGERVRLLLQHQIALFGIHLPMDKHHTLGNNWPVAHELGLQDCTAFGPADIGVVGDGLPRDAAVWLQRIQELYGVSPRVAPGAAGKISRIAIVSGGGNRYLEDAVHSKCDMLITGCADEPQWHLARESGCWMVAVGHAASERIGPRLLANWLQGQIGVPTRFIADDNPF